MTNTQKKALEHILDTLNSFNTYKLSSGAVNFMDQSQIDDRHKHSIKNLLEESIGVEVDKIKEARSWLQTLISDCEK